MLRKGIRFDWHGFHKQVVIQSKAIQNTCIRVQKFHVYQLIKYYMFLEPRTRPNSTAKATAKQLTALHQAAAAASRADT
jgi:hypothetical protein